MDDDVQRLRNNLQGEIDGATLYETLNRYGKASSRGHVFALVSSWP